MSLQSRVPDSLEYNSEQLPIAKRGDGRMNRMGDWFEWASLGIGAGGLVASIVGVVYALLARRAAKSAAAAAERASNETRRTVSRSRRTVETGKAISLINRLKVLHRNGDWEYALEMYPELRSGLSDIQASIPEGFAGLNDVIEGAIAKIRGIEDTVNLARYEPMEPANVPLIDGILNDIHQDLLRLLGTDIHGP